ncbi:PIN domain-containing protein [Bradyrhizobium sp. SZCCHNPS2010]|uniref:HTH domain-containing protein n=1 Tax=Bradyrhizobium sp. SZCCHNPS2010 TaxID=3057333 RepID=UPI0029168571|nr:hypothetical protein [Bradyrhizobium sp. SZCCHNPS2010]
MARTDRAANILALLLAEERLKTGEIAFVTHSFGGLIFEQVLRIASERAPAEPAIADLLSRIRRVSFLGTPHRGADLASWGSRLRLLARPSHAAQGLSRNDPDLRDLNQFYRTYVHQTKLDTQCLIETRPIRLLGMVVKPDSADVGLPTAPIPVDADHYEIASPESRASEVYRLIRDQLKKPLEPKTLLADPTLLQDIAESTRSTTAAVARIEERLFSTSVAVSPPSNLPVALVDAETSRRLQRIRRMRFFIDSTHSEEAVQLSQDLLVGQLNATSVELKADALAWCARALMSPSDRTEALRILGEAKRLIRTDAVSIAEALAESYDGKVSNALQKLATLNSAEARAASIIVVANAKEGRDALTWMTEAGISQDMVSPDGKFFVLKQYLDKARWDDALILVQTFTSTDYGQTPVLAYLAAGTHLVQATPLELRQIIFWQLPFDAASIPLADDASSLEARRNAIELYEQTAVLAAELGCTRASNDAQDRALWLRLRDPSLLLEARSVLEASMRDPRHSLRRLPLALQFGLRLDLRAVEREIDRQDAATDGSSVDVALARFSLAFTKQSARETADYIQKHKVQLEKYLNPFYVTAVRIEALTNSGQADEAETLLDQLPDQADLVGERGRLERLIAESRGANPVESREAEFRKSNSLADLTSLVNRLQELRDWPRLVTYGGELFNRTHGLSSLRAFGEALYETKAYDDLETTLGRHPDLAAQSSFLASLRAWALFYTGDLDGARDTLAHLRSTRDDANDRILQVNLAIASGDWTTLGSFVEQEWSHRSDRSAGELLRAGQLARQLGSARARELIIEAANHANDDPEIYLGCYGAAVSAGWEDAQTATWLERAAILSGDNGPVKKMAFKDIIDIHPEWQARETRTTEQLLAGNLPLFAAGHLLNRTLFELFMIPALANPEITDPRRRTAVYAYSAARGFFSSTALSAALDPTAILTLGFLKLTEQVFARFEKIIIPHSTLGWLFEERQRIQFHQPSRIEHAREITRLLSSKHLVKLERTAAVDDSLAAEVGFDLAALLAEAALSCESAPQRLVVRSAPVHRIGSLMEENADLSRYVAHLCSCSDIVSALVSRGQLTQAEEQRARSYLKLHESPWPTAIPIQPGAMLYLDGLSVTYFQHLGLLRKLRDAGFSAIVLPTEVDQSDSFVRYEELSRRALAVIDDVRQALAEGIASRKIILAPSVRESVTSSDRLQGYPSFEILNAARMADVLIIDDRHFNQHGNVKGDFGTRQIWTSYDVLSFLFEPHEFREHLTTLRRAGYCFLPVRADELIDLLRAARVVAGIIVETAELKAIRENLLLARLTGSLQWPKEKQWLDNLAVAFIEAIKSQWQDDIDASVASAKSDWLWAQFDIRDWASQYSKGEDTASANDRFRGLVLAVAVLNGTVQLRTKQQFWDWYTKAILEPLREQQPTQYAELVEQVRSIIVDGATASEMGEAP